MSLCLVLKIQFEVAKNLPDTDQEKARRCGGREMGLTWFLSLFREKVPDGLRGM